MKLANFDKVSYFWLLLSEIQHNKVYMVHYLINYTRWAAIKSSKRLLRLYHPTSAPEKALRRPSVAMLYPASMTRARGVVPASSGEATDPTTSDGAARQTEDVVWRTTVPGTHARAGSYELSAGSFPGNAGASRRTDARSRPAGRRPRRRPRRDVLRSQENNRRRKDADVSYDVSRRASLRREIVPGKHEQRGAGRRRDARGLIIESPEIPTMRVDWGMEIDWTAPPGRARVLGLTKIRSM